MPRKSSTALAVVTPTPEPPPASGASTPPPEHLSDAAKAWWREVLRDFDLEPHHLHLLALAAGAWDRAEQARRTLADHGAVTFVAANGDLKAHPAVAIERDARIAFARLVRELDLDGGTLAERRPPALHSNRRGA
jgi:phage terminase small subunit